MSAVQNRFEGFVGHPRFYALVEEMAVVHQAKNSDYADPASSQDPLRNFRQCEKFGVNPVDGILTRMSDKWERICNLRAKSKRGEDAAVKSEAITDTLVDLANYAMLCVILFEEEQNDARPIPLVQPLFTEAMKRDCAELLPQAA